MEGHRLQRYITTLPIRVPIAHSCTMLWIIGLLAYVCYIELAYCTVERVSHRFLDCITYRIPFQADVYNDARAQEDHQGASIECHKSDTMKRQIHGLVAVWT
jgi:hypothetical protein